MPQPDESSPAAARDPQPEDAAAQSPAKTGLSRALIKRLLRRHWLTSVIAASLVLHGMGFWYFQAQRAQASRARLVEVDLGRFDFINRNAGVSPVVSARFDLHLELLSDVEQAARAKLTAHRFKVQQDIEELLRQAHGGDFEDPTLIELKRQLQEQINQSVGMRAIEEVIITDLEIERGSVVGEDVAEDKPESVWVDERTD